MRCIGCQAASPEGKLLFGDIPAETLAERYGTPLYVIDEPLFREKIRAFKNAACRAHENSRIFYSVKANFALSVLSIAKSEGVGVDVCSEGELLAALRAGFTPPEIHLHGSYKRDTELRLAAELGVDAIVLDNLSEIDRLAELACSMGRPVRVMLRLAPGVDPDTHEAVQTGQEDSKFGISIAGNEAYRAVEEIRRKGCLQLVGLHCHVGSQLSDATAVVEGVKRVVQFALSIKGIWGDIEEINAGGGLGISYLPTERIEDFDTYCSRVAGAVLHLCKSEGCTPPRIGYEPGRALIGEAGTTLYRVGVRKDLALSNGVGERRYLIVDGGLSDNPRPLFYGAKYTVLNASRLLEPHDTSFRVVGRHCETDLLIEDALLPLSTKDGDILAVQCTGAYNFSMASQYNLFPRPPMVLVGMGEPFLAVERQQEESFFAGQHLRPEMLSEGATLSSLSKVTGILP
ncbi:MAG: diaminopimelate decarboxylase [Candidatus Caldarchaeum sp.]